MLTLKPYQQDCLNELHKYFTLTQEANIKQAFELCQQDQHLQSIVPYIDRMNGVPSVCLRVPTGGGKTLLASHAIGVVADALHIELPLVIWLVPSDTIKEQTITALQNPNHPYRQAVEAKFSGTKVCDIETIGTLSQYDFDHHCVILVSTIQAFNINKNKIDKRNAYSFDENLSKFFTSIPDDLLPSLDKVNESTVENQSYLTSKDIGRVKHSLMNLFHLYNPIIIVDEAHKNRGGESFFDTMQRFNPRCVVELTATPKDNNVLYSVSAYQLKADSMIKLPVILTEHPNTWEDCVQDALLRRQELEKIAQKEPSRYVRPILLIQAQNKNGEANVDAVKKYLIESLHIDESWIAIATGEQKELDGINLFDRSCPIRIVITVEALKEGWDCAFAYVLASLQNMQSAIGVEQLLGRILRMPNATKFDAEELNHSYAHVVSVQTSDATTRLKDKMVQNMGFEQWEAEGAFTVPVQAPLFDTPNTDQPKIAPEVVLNLPFELKADTITPELKSFVQEAKTTNGTVLIIRQGTSSEQINDLEAVILNNASKKQQEKTREAFGIVRSQRRAAIAPENWNATFAPIAQLGLLIDDEWCLADLETIQYSYEWDLLDYKLELDNFVIKENSSSFALDIDSRRQQITTRHISSDQNHVIDFGHMQTTITQSDLIRWLDRQLAHEGITRTQLLAYLTKLVEYLQYDDKRKFTLTQLQRAKFALKNAISDKINELSKTARKDAFQGDLFGRLTVADELTAANSFEFKRGIYPVRRPYQGSYEFSKHFYEQIDDLKEKRSDGKETHEFICAKVLDMHPKIKHWVRNIPKQPKTSFWLPTDEDLFYPDFVAELHDGRILVLEYKGEHLKAVSRVKDEIGRRWANISNNLYITLYSEGTYDDMKRQLDQLIDM